MLRKYNLNGLSVRVCFDLRAAELHAIKLNPLLVLLSHEVNFIFNVLSYFWLESRLNVEVVHLHKLTLRVFNLPDKLA